MEPYRPYVDLAVLEIIISGEEYEELTKTTERGIA